MHVDLASYTTSNRGPPVSTSDRHRPIPRAGLIGISHEHQVDWYFNAVRLEVTLPLFVLRPGSLTLFGAMRTLAGRFAHATLVSEYEGYFERRPLCFRTDRRPERQVGRWQLAVEKGPGVRHRPRKPTQPRADDPVACRHRPHCGDVTVRTQGLRVSPEREHVCLSSWHSRPSQS